MPQLTRSASLTNYADIASAVGLDPRRMLRLAKLPLRALDDPNLLISADSFGWLLEESARLSDQESFGLLLAETRNPSNLGMLMLLVREEPTMRSALQSFIRYVHVHNGGVQFRLENAGDLVLLHVDMRLQRPGPWRQCVEGTVGIVVRAFRLLSCGALHPVAIHFAHAPPRSLSIHHRVLGRSVRFSQELNTIAFRARDLDMPMPAADPQFKREVKRWLDLQLAELPDNPLDRTRQIVRILLPTGACSVEHVAQHLGVHRRTLNRHLEAVGESVSSVITTVRSQLAQEYLADRSRKLYEVADLLGFGSSADFSHWFRRKFGMSPSVWSTLHGKPSVQGRKP